MTNDIERTSMSKLQSDVAKQYRNKNATRLSDESSNPCVKVTLLLEMG